jgi:hypothetical protein
MRREINRDFRPAGHQDNLMTLQGAADFQSAEKMAHAPDVLAVVDYFHDICFIGFIGFICFISFISSNGYRSSV